MSRELYQATVTLRPGAERFVRALQDRGIPCALATTNDESVLGAMRNVDVYSLFGTCVHGKDVGRGKDHPDIYLEVARRLQVAPHRCVVFEDIVPAVLSAKRAGMTACGVRANDDSQDVDSLRAAADLWLEDWRDITCVSEAT